MNLKHLAAFASFLAVFLLANTAANACSCLPPKSATEEMKQSTAVFLGKVVAIIRHSRESNPFRSVEVRLSVDKSWKGSAGPEQTIFTSSNSAACGYPFSQGSTYLVYANADEGDRLVTGLCTRTRGIDDAKEDLAELDTAASSRKAESTAMPKWLADHFAFMTAGSGRWITDNAKFRSENEPFEEYGTEWKWGVGKKSIKGRLFALNGNKEVGEFWEYRVFWHPNDKRAVFEQFGAGGVFGTGEMRQVDLGDRKAELNVEMIFYSPDGSSWQDLHKLTESPNQHITRSFTLKDGQWQPRRTYTWLLDPQNHLRPPGPD